MRRLHRALERQLSLGAMLAALKECSPDVIFVWKTPDRSSVAEVSLIRPDQAGDLSWRAEAVVLLAAASIGRRSSFYGPSL